MTTGQDRQDQQDRQHPQQPAVPTHSRLTLAGSRMRHFHVCAFFNSREEEHQVLGPFYAEAVRLGERNLHMVDGPSMQDHRSRLAAGGLDVPACEACGQLVLMPWHHAYLDDTGHFDRRRMLTLVDQVGREASAAGSSRVRVMGQMDWIVGKGIDRSEVIAYEAEVNEVLVLHQQPAICVYDIASLDGALMMDLLRTHPLTLIGGALRENPFYTPPAQMLRELAARQDKAAGTAAP
ncbi:MEDS: MEthanogen/methylotroph, DcmR Sensory domain [Roseateles sp. YR242]|uniref:MEDS domain-containing protein n=1 Tax=Roseateles sp. YR242 TaxID=1855305 RepID=UPI0008AE9021|nr:MEDS domain-containing protein [Roseateles sp. YR242]SEL06347.1 MEDS: MEthanogen/methylotroph, DcmR Sensory domain [Roseateles sp. YR242]